jgi:hypothetical protein
MANLESICVNFEVQSVWGNEFEKQAEGKENYL